MKLARIPAMEPPESLLSDYYLSERDLHQLMEHLIDERADASTVLAFSDKIEFEPEQTLIRQADVDAAMLILTEGTLEVLIEEEGTARSVATIEPFALVGEQSFIDAGPRTATVVARTKGIAHRLTDSGFEQLRAANPEAACAFLGDVSRALAQRLRQRG